jgi:hypothetical protein
MKVFLQFCQILLGQTPPLVLNQAGHSDGKRQHATTRKADKRRVDQV